MSRMDGSATTSGMYWKVKDCKHQKLRIRENPTLTTKLHSVVGWLKHAASTGAPLVCRTSEELCRVSPLRWLEMLMNRRKSYNFSCFLHKRRAPDRRQPLCRNVSEVPKSNVHSIDVMDELIPEQALAATRHILANEIARSTLSRIHPSNSIFLTFSMLQSACSV